MPGEGDRTFTYDRVAFVLPRKRMLEIEAALAELAAGRLAAIEALLRRSRRERRAWEKKETVPLGKRDRALLVAMLGAETELPRAGTQVRRAFLRPALTRAVRFERFQAIAPPDMAARAVELTRADVRAFDPASRMPRAARPELPGFPDPKTGAHTTRTVMLDAWLEGVLEDAFELPSLVTVTFEAAPGPPSSGRRRRDANHASCYRGEPVWTDASVRLARALDDGRVLAGATGGPVTFMFAGDPIAKELDPKIARAARRLGAADALVAFTFLHTDVLGGDWNDRK
ncbi:MAG: hypothetical protein U0270_09810 [Labilithrix sp.]